MPSVIERLTDKCRRCCVANEFSSVGPFRVRYSRASRGRTVSKFHFESRFFSFSVRFRSDDLREASRSSFSFAQLGDDDDDDDEYAIYRCIEIRKFRWQRSFLFSLDVSDFLSSIYNWTRWFTTRAGINSVRKRGRVREIVVHW